MRFIPTHLYTWTFSCSSAQYTSARLESIDLALLVFTFACLTSTRASLSLLFSSLSLGYLFSFFLAQSSFVLLSFFFLSLTLSFSLTLSSCFFGCFRALMRYGAELPGKFDLSSLRVLGSVGEPINPEAWRWYFSVIGQHRCTIVDTYWQTETGGHVLTPIPGAMITKPGSACFPFLGIEPAVLDPHTGEEKRGNNVCGVLCLKRPWPGRTSGGSRGRSIEDSRLLWRCY